MIGIIDPLVENARLRELLRAYDTLRQRNPDAEWHDRVMAVSESNEVSPLHGLLLAFGWIETRVHAEAFNTPGQISKSYRITREGTRALKAAQNPYSPISEDEPMASDWLTGDLES